MFVSSEPVRIALPESEDAIYIKAKMDYGTKQRVMAAGVQMSRDAGFSVADGMSMAIDIGSFQIAQLIHNIVKWEGPSFAGVACVPESIIRLDPDEPLVKLVLQEIAQRNKAPDSPSPKAPTTPTLSSGGA